MASALCALLYNETANHFSDQTAGYKKPGHPESCHQSRQLQLPDNSTMSSQLLALLALLLLTVAGGTSGASLASMLARRLVYELEAQDRQGVAINTHGNGSTPLVVVNNVFQGECLGSLQN